MLNDTLPLADRIDAARTELTAIEILLSEYRAVMNDLPKSPQAATCYNYLLVRLSEHENRHRKQTAYLVKLENQQLELYSDNL